MGKHKPIFTPHMDTGDHVVVVNASKVALTGSKPEKKKYFHHTHVSGRRDLDGVSRRARPKHLIASSTTAVTRHVAEDQARTRDAEEAQGLRGRRASPRGSAARWSGIPEPTVRNAHDDRRSTSRTRTGRRKEAVARVTAGRRRRANTW